jgi:hypothetical protein
MAIFGLNPDGSGSVHYGRALLSNIEIVIIILNDRKRSEL